MIDLSHIPETPGLRVFLPQGVNANSWQAWQKPRGFVMASIYAIGPGGGGGSGRAASVASATVRGSGAGGGSGGVSRLTIPLFLLPDTLYIRVTPGGSGGASVAALSDGTAGNVGFTPSTTLIAVYPSTTAQYLFLRADAGGGGAAGNTGTATAGAAATIAALTGGPLGNLGATLFIAGNAGANGGSTASSITQGTGSQIYGGASGAGVASSSSATNNGGSISNLSNSPFRVSSGGTSSSIHGGSGFSWSTIFPVKHYGGAGGAGVGNGVGGDGGNGGVPGAGGGGGGGGGTNSGKGGDGGPGCVIIQCW